jgi:hypothetical protein
MSESELPKVVTDLWVEATVLTYDTAEDREKASKLFRTLKTIRKDAVDERMAMTRPLDESKKLIMEKYQGILDQVDKAIASVQAGMLKYDSEQDRIRAEAAAKAAQEAAAARRALEAQAAAAAKSGDQETATAIAEAAVTIQAAPPPPEVKHAGESKQTYWSAEVTNLVELVAAVASGLAPLSCVEACMPALNALAKAHKEGLKIPGVRAVSKEVLKGRSL